MRSPFTRALDGSLISERTLDPPVAVRAVRTHERCVPASRLEVFQERTVKLHVAPVSTLCTFVPLHISRREPKREAGGANSETTMISRIIQHVLAEGSCRLALAARVTRPRLGFLKAFAALIRVLLESLDTLALAASSARVTICAT